MIMCLWIRCVSLSLLFFFHIVYLATATDPIISSNSIVDDEILYDEYTRYSQRHRSTIFFRFWCELGLPFSPCSCNERTVRSQVALGGDVLLCPGTTNIGNEIDLTGVSVNFRCYTFLSFEGCTISGQGITRLFSGSPNSVIFEGITLREGNGINESILRGGVFYFTGGTIEVNSCALNDNRAESGGAISLEGSTTRLIIDDSSFSGNSGDSGGAIYAFRGAEVQIFNSVFKSNTATKGAGGALYFDRSKSAITDSTFYNNDATLISGTGGALFVVNSAIDLKNSVFLDNVAGEGLPSNGNDIFISDNAPTTDILTASSVQCSAISPVVFCNGKDDSIYEFGGTIPVDNTNCDVRGINDPGDGTCSM